VVYFGGFFAKLGHFEGFYLHIINFVEWISEAAKKGLGDIIFHKLGAQRRVHPHTVIFCGVFSIFVARISEAALWVGRRSGDII
jgi:hypothetical protein